MKRPSSERALAVARWAVLAVAAVMVVVGLLLGEGREVFWKAATLCLECIGIA